MPTTAVAGVSLAAVVVVTLPEGTEHRESFEPLDRFLAGGLDSGVVIDVEFEVGVSEVDKSCGSESVVIRE
jgi:hypothetical protein